VDPGSRSPAIAIRDALNYRFIRDDEASGGNKKG